MKHVTLVARILVGGLFIFSGLIKANDPLGFQYKLDEYFDVFGAISGFHWMIWFKKISLAMSMFICVFEVACGFATILGVFPKINAWLLLLMIVFFTWLTGYSALSGKVQECGCFGDAIKLTPWQSFYKDLILLFFILIIFIWKKTINPLFKKLKLNYSLVTFGLLFSCFFTWRAYAHLPWVDFRPYKIGTNIREKVSIPPGTPQDEYEIIFKYRNGKNGEIKEFDMNHIPMDTFWHYVDRKDKLIKEGYKPPIHDFIITDDSGNPVTDTILNNPDYNFWVVSYDMHHTDKSAFAKINELAKACDKEGIKIVGLTATPYDELDPIRHELNAAFPFYYMDNVVLKTIIRSNPGIVLLKNSVTLGMWHANDVPSLEEVKKSYFKK